jgi:Tol biopolymer transport system component
LYLYPVEGGEPRVAQGVTASELVIQWSPDGKALLVHDRGRLPIAIYSVDVMTGRRSVFKEITEGAGATDLGVLGLSLSPDGAMYAYTHYRIDSTLYLGDGLK